MSAPSSPVSRQTSKSYLILLPTELLLSILSFLRPIDLAAVSAACRTLHTHAITDHLWQGFIQENVPGHKITKPYPYPDFRSLYQAHDTRWFLPKYKIWISDKEWTGRLVIARFDQRRGCIEGYQLVAVSKQREMQPWEADNNITIHAFEPEVHLHLDRPILELQGANTEETLALVEKIRLMRMIRTILMESYKPSGNSSAGSFPSLEHPEWDLDVGRFEAEIPMHIFDSDDSTFCTYLPARPLSLVELQSRETPSFPYGSIWPPPTIPSPHRVRCAGSQRNAMNDDALFRYERGPASRSEVSERAFRVRNCLTHPVTITSLPAPSASDTLAPILNLSGTSTGPVVLPQLRRSFNVPSHQEVTTYVTLEPELYTPTKDKPFRGIWVGDYSGHGCEFLVLMQPDDEGTAGPEITKRKEGESDEGFEKRKYEERIYRGTLEAVKLTGDRNVPRGELTFRVDDLGPAGYIRSIERDPFRGARVVKSMGHIANTGFRSDRFIESQLIILSHDRLAQYWVEWGHISFFERVNIDEFLVPR
ncbi:hypothetical protein QBC44DRAFT_320787 [Cladorrhinum sp. PSN332]|nr:hypothetical protein QBC44DRAFT_320787 [Cladorrhinum sp. PSN332]